MSNRTRHGWNTRPARPLTCDEVLDKAEAALDAGKAAAARRLVERLGYIDLIATGGDTAAAMHRIGRARAIVAKAQAA